MIAVLLLAVSLSKTPPSPALESLALESLALERLDGRAVGVGAPVVLMFWRADCAPCRLELGDLAALRRAARPMRLRLVGLQPAAALKQGLRAEALPADASLRTPEEARAVLTAWGGPPPRLPLAVALDAEGRICGRRTGLLGAEQLVAWAKACGGARAAR